MNDLLAQKQSDTAEQHRRATAAANLGAPPALILNQHTDIKHGRPAKVCWGATPTAAKNIPLEQPIEPCGTAPEPLPQRVWTGCIAVILQALQVALAAPAPAPLTSTRATLLRPCRGPRFRPRPHLQPFTKPTSTGLRMRWASKSQTPLQRRKDRSAHRLMLRAPGSHRLSTLECTYIATWLRFLFSHLSVLACTHNWWRWLRHARYLYLHLHLHSVRHPALEPSLQLMPLPHSPTSIICPPSQRHIPVAC